MVLIAKLISIALVLCGFAMILKKELLNKIIEYVKEGNRVYGIAVGRALFGIILLNVASISRVPWVIVLIGLLLIVSGILCFVLKKEKVIGKIDKIFTDPSERTLRLIGTVPMVVGVLLLCAL
jgi:uncharacterized protein YjeT (DUF2065 family)